jgi:hypothetical protein
MRLVLGATALATTLVASLVQPADAAWTQPYGGCKEAWQAPRSQGAADCRAHGWVVRPRLVVSPRTWVRHSTLPHCPSDDVAPRHAPCSWNFGPGDGNGWGDQFYVLPSRTGHLRYYYVNGVR